MPFQRAHFKDNRGKIVYTDFSKLEILGTAIASGLTTSFNKYCAAYNSGNQGTALGSLLRTFADFASTRTVDFSTAPKTYSTFFDFRNYWYRTNTNNLKLRYRNDYWYIFLQFLRFCMEEGSIPQSALPPGNPKFYGRDFLDSCDAADAVKIDSLVPIDLSRTDEQYLDSLEMQLRAANEAFLSCAREEIAQLSESLEEGDKLLRLTSYNSLKDAIARTVEAGHPYRERLQTAKGKRLVNLFSPRHPMFKPNLLTHIKHELNGVFRGHRSSTSRPERELRFIYDGFRADELSGYLGLLTTRRAIPFFVFLLIKNPKFTVSALLSAQIECKGGVHTLLTTAGENGDVVRMQVTKPRAHSDKSELLDDETYEVIQLLIRLTDPLRAYLKRVGSSDFNRLWVAIPSGGKAPYWLTEGAIARMFGRHVKRLDDPTLNPISARIAKNSFLNTHKQLHAYKNSATPRLLRITQGLLVWFQSGGDAQQVARALGNTVRISLRHYIPRTLQVIMNKRMIRRYQNLLLAAATVNEPYFLESTDFSSLDTLHSFLASTLLYDDDISRSLKKVLDSTGTIRDSEDKEITEAIFDGTTKIRVSVSEQCLAVLFLYAEHVEKHLRSNPHVEAAYGLNPSTPTFWSTLARVLHRSLPSDRTRREFHLTYRNAILLCNDLRGKLSFPLPLAQSSGEHL